MTDKKNVVKEIGLNLYSEDKNVEVKVLNWELFKANRAKSQKGYHTTDMYTFHNGKDTLVKIPQQDSTSEKPTSMKVQLLLNDTSVGIKGKHKADSITF